MWKGREEKKKSDADVDKGSLRNIRNCHPEESQIDKRGLSIGSSTLMQLILARQGAFADSISAGMAGHSAQMPSNSAQDQLKGLRPVTPISSPFTSRPPTTESAATSPPLRAPV